MIELCLITLGLIITVIFSYKSTRLSNDSYQLSRQSYQLSEATEQEAKENFLLERTTDYAARFDDVTFVRIRAAVDRWVDSKESVDTLLKRYEAHDPAAEDMYDDLRAYANFFEELGVAIEFNTLDEHYAWGIFGSAAQRADTRLGPFILALQNRYKRPGLLTDVATLAARMKGLDVAYQAKKSTIPLTKLPPASQP